MRRLTSLAAGTKPSALMRQVVPAGQSPRTTPATPTAAPAPSTARTRPAAVPEYGLRRDADELLKVGYGITTRARSSCPPLGSAGSGTRAIAEVNGIDPSAEIKRKMAQEREPHLSPR